MALLNDTARLRLLPFTAERARAAGSSRASLAADIGASVPDDWPNPDLADALPLFVEMLETMPALSTWIVLAVERTEGVLIGSGGFIGLPDENGAVELGFGLVPARQGKGYASEIAREMLSRAFKEPTVERVVGRCAPDNLPSRRLLERLGFAPDGVDEEENLMWRLDRDQASAYSTAASA